MNHIHTYKGFSVKIPDFNSREYAEKHLSYTDVFLIGYNSGIDSATNNCSCKNKSKHNEESA